DWLSRPPVHEERRAHSFAREPEAEHEVAVQRLVRSRERDADRFRAAARAGRMLRARETFESSLRRIAEELDFHGNGHLGIEPRSEPGRTQARGIRDAVGVEGR